MREGKVLGILGDITAHAMPIVTNVHFVVLTLGAFLFPVLVSIAAPLWSRDRMRKIWIAGAVVVMAILSAVRYAFGRRVLMPILRNVLHKSGVGPLTLRDTYILQLPHVSALPRAFWVVVTAMAVIGAGCLLAIAGAVVVRLFRRLRTGGSLPVRDAVSAFLLLAAGIYLTPVLIAGLFDRYLIPVLPLVAVGLAGIDQPFVRVTPVARGLRTVMAVVLSAMCLFTIGATHDYLAWNRVRWQALNDLMTERRVGPDSIDGGFEFNGRFLYDTAYVEDPTKSWWWVHDDTYQVSFGPLEGYEIVKEYPYANWVLPRQGRIVVQRRLTAR